MALTKPAGTWTYEDLFSLPDDGKRYEIIEGVLYEMPSPKSAHALAVINMIALLLPIQPGEKPPAEDLTGKGRTMQTAPRRKADAPAQRRR